MKKFLLELVFMISLVLFASQAFSSYNKSLSGSISLIELAKAENSCNPDIYEEILKAKSYPSLTVSNSLPNAIYKCHKSGNLKKMVQTNLDHGGKISQSREFTNIDMYSLFGYDSTPLGFLNNIQTRQKLTPTQTRDITQTACLLMKNHANADRVMLHSVDN